MKPSCLQTAQHQRNDVAYKDDVKISASKIETWERVEKYLVNQHRNRRKNNFRRV
jgi:hypothetical protein